MNIPDSLIAMLTSLAIPALGGWVWKIQRDVTQHETIIQKLDQLLDILLKDRLSK